MTDQDWIQLGEIDVDAGLVMIGDPCYTLPADGSRRTDELANWQEFCKLLNPAGDGISEPAGEGAGIVVRVAAGDGTYPVLGRRGAGGGLTAIKVLFEPEDDDWDWD